MLQLVERPAHGEYVLDFVQADTPDQLRAFTQARGGPQPLSAGSDDLLYLAVVAPSVELRTMRVELADRSGREAAEEAAALEDVLLDLVRRFELDAASAVLRTTPTLYVERVVLEDPSTRAVVACNRDGIITIQGPAAERRAHFTIALLAAFRRVFEVPR